MPLPRHLPTPLPLSRRQRLTAALLRVLSSVTTFLHLTHTPQTVLRVTIGETTHIRVYSEPLDA